MDHRPPHLRRTDPCDLGWGGCWSIPVKGGATEAVRRTAKWLGITEAQVRIAESYDASFPDEIDDRLEISEAAAATTQAAGEVRRRLYG